MGRGRVDERDTESFEAAEWRILEQLADGVPLGTILDAIVQVIESRARGALCSILLYDERDQTLHHGSAPNLPEPYVRALDGSRVGPLEGSCGAAAFHRTRVVVEDIRTHPFWDPYRALAEAHGLRACWSSPILSSAGSLLGTFAIYYAKPRSPRPDEEAAVQSATHLAALAILRDRAQESLRRSEERARETAHLYAVSSAINEAIARVRHSEDLHLIACRIAVEQGLAKLAWVGRHDPSRDHIDVLARFGADNGYLEALHLRLQDPQLGWGPAGRALRSNEPAISDDIATDPDFSSKAEALTRGFRSCGAFPMRRQGPTCDVLVIYSSKIGYFRGEAERVLAALADDIAFAVDSVEAEQERQRLLGALQERVKELGTLHAVSRALRGHPLPHPELLSELVALLPGGWQFPDLCRARLRWDELTAETPGFVESPWKLSHAFGSAGESGAPRGLIEVVYMRAPSEPHGAFLPEELELLRSIGEMLARSFEQAEAERKLRSNEALLRMAGRAARLGAWRIEFPSFRLTGSKQTFDIIGLPANAALDLQQGLEYCDSAYREFLAAEVHRCLREGYPFDLEVPLVTATGKRIWTRIIGQAERDAQERIVCISGALQDIDERRALEEQLRQSQKMEAVGQLAGGVAHDFNNMLSVILSYTELVSGSLAADSPLRPDLAQIAQAARRAGELTHQLLAFSRRQVLRPRHLELNEILTSTQRMLRRVVGDDISVILHQAPDLDVIRADPGQIEQMLINLVINARDAMPLGGTLTLETSNVFIDAASARGRCRPGSYVRLTITDTGVGMDAATRARVFEPFFTTKGPAKGTGLGLSMVWGSVMQSGGHIEITSHPNEGARIEIYFPRAEQEREPRVARSDRQAHQGGNETILLVENEDQVRTLVGTVLRRNGYTVLETQNAGEAFLIAEQHEGELHLLLTDVVMPRISGVELAERLAATGRDLRVLYVSGYTENSLVRDTMTQNEGLFLAKPFTTDALLDKVREVLDQPRASEAPSPPSPDEHDRPAP